MEHDQANATSVLGGDEMTCQQMTALLVAYVAGELEATTRQRFQAHLHLCKDCLAYLQTYQTTIAATRSVRYDDIPAALQERLSSFLRERGILGDQ